MGVLVIPYWFRIVDLLYPMFLVNGQFTKMSNRVSRSNSTPADEEVELIETENRLVRHVIAPEVLVGQEQPSNRGRGGCTTHGRGRGRGRGRISQRAEIQAPPENPRRTRVRTARRERSVEVHGGRPVSRHKSSGSAQVEGQGL